MKGKMITVFVLVLALVLSCTSTKSFSQDFSRDKEMLSFVITGRNFMSSIALPDTWAVDVNIARQGGLNGFFYLKDYGVMDSPAVLILSLWGKQNVGSKLENLIEDDVKGFLGNFNGYTAEEQNWEIPNKGGYRIRVFYLKNDAGGPVQYSAYLDVGQDYYVSLYVTIMEKEKHDETVDDFKRCLENSIFFGAGLQGR